jgi:alpha-galactosidase
MASKKIACLGAGSLYFMSGIPDIILADGLSGSEICLYDIEREKARLMADACRRIAVSIGAGFKIKVASSLSEAVDSADFVVTSIGGSGADISSNVYSSYYHAVDMHISAKYGIHQIIGDTCGPAGMMMAFRSIPVYMEVCKEMEKRCPKAVLFNHSNPMAVLCRAMRKYSCIHTIGICHGVQAGILYAAKLLDVKPEELECTWVGTNHYYWFTSVFHKKEDMYPVLRERLIHTEKQEGRILSAELSRIYGYHIVYPSDDHIIEFYPFLTQFPSGQDLLPYGLAKSARAHGFDERQSFPVREPKTEKTRQEFFKKYKEILSGIKVPEQRVNKIYGEAIGSIIESIALGHRDIYILNIPNEGAIPNLPSHSIVEIEAVTDSRGVRPVVMGGAPPVLRGILEKRFVWQELVVDAGVKGDRNLALQALMVDEMAIIPEKAEKMLDELLVASKELLPQFFKKAGKIIL